MPRASTASVPRRSRAAASGGGSQAWAEALLRGAEAALEAGWLLLAAITPLALDTLHAQPALPKGQILQLVVLLMALVWLGRLILLRRTGASEPGSGVPRRFLVLTGAYAATVLLATVLSPVPAVAFWGGYVRGEGAVATLAYLVLFLIVAERLRTAAQWERLVTVLLGASLPVCLYGIAQALGLDPLTWEQIGPAGRVGSTAGNAIFLAAYLILLLPLTTWRLRQALSPSPAPPPPSGGRGRKAVSSVTPPIDVRGTSAWATPAILATGVVALAVVLVAGARRPDAWWALPPVVAAFALALAAAPPLPPTARLARCLAYGTLLLLQAWTLVLTASIGPLLALGGAIGLAVVLYAARRRHWPLLGALAGVAILASAFVVVLNLPNSPLAPLQERVLLLRRLGNLEQTGAGLRLTIWRATADLLLHPRALTPTPDPFADVRPLVGYGPETIGYQVNRVLPPPAELELVLGGFWDRTHNALLDHLLTVGALGLATYLLLVGAVLLRAGRAAWAELAGQRYGVRTAVLVALAGHLLEIQTSMLVLPSVALFWLLAGAAVSAPWDRAPAAQPEGQTVARAAPWQSAWPIVVYAALAGLMLVGLLALPDRAPPLPTAVLTAGGVLAGLLAAAWVCRPLAGRGAAALGLAGLLGIALALLLGSHQVRLLAADAAFKRAEEAQGLRDFPRAILAGQEAVTLAPDLAEYWSVLGQYYAAFGGATRAAARPDFAPTVDEARTTRLATLLGRDQLFALGQLCLEEAIRRDPLEFRYQYTLGELYRYWGELSEDPARLAQARVLFEQAAALKPNDVEVEAGIADTLLLLGDTAQALARAERARALLPTYWYPHAILARAHAARGESAQAVAAARRALETAPVTRGVKGLSAFERERLQRIIDGATEPTNPAPAD